MQQRQCVEFRQRLCVDAVTVLGDSLCHVTPLPHFKRQEACTTDVKPANLGESRDIAAVSHSGMALEVSSTHIHMHRAFRDLAIQTTRTFTVRTLKSY